MYCICFIILFHRSSFMVVNLFAVARLKNIEHRDNDNNEANIYHFQCTNAGLVLSTWPSLKILKLKTPSPTSTPTPSEYHDSNTTTAATNTLDDMNNTATIPVIRQRRVSNIDIKSITHNGGIQNQNKTRRKSLPALGAPSARVSLVCFFF